MALTDQDPGRGGSGGSGGSVGLKLLVQHTAPLHRFQGTDRNPWDASHVRIQGVRNEDKAKIRKIRSTQSTASSESTSTRPRGLFRLLPSRWDFRSQQLGDPSSVCDGSEGCEAVESVEVNLDSRMT